MIFDLSSSMFNFTLSEYLDRNKVSGEVMLRMEWDLAVSDGQLQVFIEKDHLATFNSHRAPLIGFNYFKIKSENGFSKNNRVIPLIFNEC